MALGAPRKKSNTGISISSNRVVAWMAGGTGAKGGEEWSQAIAPMPPTAAEWPELEIALRALAAESGGGSLFIALRPPLVQVRSIELPPVDPADAVRLVSRSAGKYFVGAREPQVIGVHAEEADGASTMHTLACAASVRLIEAIRDAADGAGWKVARIVPAHAAWLAAADHVWAKSDAFVDHGRLVVVDDDRTEVLFKRGGRPDSFRHLRGMDEDAARLLDILSPAAEGDHAPGTAGGRSALRPVAIIGSEASRKAIAPTLRERGLLPLEPEGVWTKIMGSAGLSAAHFAPLTEELELVSDQVRNKRTEKLHRAAIALGIAAAVLFMLGLGARHWGLRKELVDLQAQRATIQGAVAQVRDAQRRIGTLAAPAVTLDSVRSNATRWSLVLSDVAQQLPRDSYLTGIRMERDSVNLTGQGSDAGTAIQALRSAQALQDVRQAGQIRRDGEIAYFILTGSVRKEITPGERQ